MERHEAHWGPGWTEHMYAGRPYRLRFKVDRKGTKPRVTHLCIEPDPSFDSAITASTLRDLAPEVGRLVDQDTAWWQALTEGKDPFTALPERWTEDELPIVRDIWVRCQREGRSTRKVLTDLGLPERKADRLISRARARWPEVMGTARRGPRTERGANRG